MHNMSVPTLQNTNMPDFDIEAQEGEALLGMEVAEVKGLRINMSGIIVSALVFLAILAWFDFMQTAFFVWLSPDNTQDIVSPAVKLWYAVFTTLFVAALVLLLYYHLS